MLPEKFQPRPRPAYGVKKVSQTFPPMSRVDRRVRGEAKATATVPGNTKEEEEEEDRAKEFTKFVKTLNKKVRQRRTTPRAREVVEGDSASRPTRTSEQLQRLTAWLARSADAARSGSRLSSKREAAKSATEPIWRRAVKRVKVKIAMSSTVKPEDIPRPHNPVNQIQIVANTTDTNIVKTLVGPTDAMLVHGRTLYHQLPGADIIQNQLPFNQHPVITPGLSHVLAHQNVLLPGPEIHNHDYLQMERTAAACAYMAIYEPMDLSPDFPSRVANEDYGDLTAIACAYAAMGEPMDTTLNDTQGPMTYAVHQNAPPVVGFVGNPQEPHFNHVVTFQQPVYEALCPPGLIDHDYHLWRPTYAHIDNQIPPQPYQEPFVNGNLPLRHYHQYPQGEEHLGLLPDFGHNAPIQPVVQQIFYEQVIPGMNPVQQQPGFHRQPIGHAVLSHPAIQGERIVQRLNGLVPEHDVGGNWNTDRGWQHAGEGHQHDDLDFFVDVFGGNIVEQEEPNRHAGEAHILDRIEVLFGDSGEEDDDEIDYDNDSDDDDDNEEENELQITYLLMIPPFINAP